MSNYDPIPRRTHHAWMPRGDGGPISDQGVMECTTEPYTKSMSHGDGDPLVSIVRCTECGALYAGELS